MICSMTGSSPSGARYAVRGTTCNPEYLIPRCSGGESAHPPAVRGVGIRVSSRFSLSPNWRDCRWSEGVCIPHVDESDGQGTDMSALSGSFPLPAEAAEKVGTELELGGDVRTLAGTAS